MIRGTTSQFKFEIPYDFSDLKSVNVVFWQDGNDGPSEARKLPLILQYNKDDGGLPNSLSWSSESNQIVATFDPEQTARFMDDRTAKIQLSATTTSGIRFASEQQSITVYPIYEGMEFSDEDVAKPSPNDGYIILDGGIAKV